MSQASDYITLLSLGKDANPKGLKIRQIGQIDNKSAWRFPDGSVIVRIKDKEFMEIEELK